MPRKARYDIVRTKRFSRGDSIMNTHITTSTDNRRGTAAGRRLVGAAVACATVLLVADTGQAAIDRDIPALLNKIQQSAQVAATQNGNQLKRTLGNIFVQAQEGVVHARMQQGQTTAYRGLPAVNTPGLPYNNAAGAIAMIGNAVAEAAQASQSGDLQGVVNNLIWVAMSADYAWWQTFQSGFVPANSAMVPGVGAFFEIEGDKAYMAGVIDSRIRSRVQSLLASGTVRTIVMVEVPGSADDDSNVVAARQANQAGLATALVEGGHVASGGTDFFLAGRARTAGNRYFIGVHSWAGNGTSGYALRDRQRNNNHRIFTQYYSQIGIDSRFYWFTIQYPPQTMHYMTPTEVASFNLLSTASTSLPQAPAQPPPAPPAQTPPQNPPPQQPGQNPPPQQGAAHPLAGQWTEVRRDGRPNKAILIQGGILTETLNGRSESGVIEANGGRVTFTFNGSGPETFGFEVANNGNRVNFTHPLTGFRIRRFHWVRPPGAQLPNQQPPNQQPPNQQPPLANVQPPQTPNNPPPVNPPPPAQAPANDLLAEARKAAEYLNRVRANPAAFTHLHPSLAQVQAKPPLQWNDALQRAAQRKAQWIVDNGLMTHVMNIGGQRVGMNQWMREAGYPLIPVLRNDESNFENLYGEATGVDIGQKTIEVFLREGSGGSHVMPTLGQGFWAHCKDIGVGIARAPSGLNFVSLLVGAYDPFDPNNVPPGAAQNPPAQNPRLANPPAQIPPGPNAPPANPPAQNPPAQNPPAQNPPPPRVSKLPIAFTVVNQSSTAVPVAYQDNAARASIVVGAGKSETFSVDHGSQVKYRTAVGSGATTALSSNRTITVPTAAATVEVQNSGGEEVSITIQQPSLEQSLRGEHVFVLKAAVSAKLGAGPSIRRFPNIPFGSTVKVSSATGAKRHTVAADATISYP